MKGQPPAATAKAARKKPKTGSLSGRKILLEVADTCKQAHHIKAAVWDDKDEQYTAAVEWCHTHDKGARAFISAHPNNEKFSLVKKSALDERLKGTVRVTSKEQHADKRILTELEEAELALWLKDMNLGRNGQDNDQIDARCTKSSSPGCSPTRGEGANASSCRTLRKRVRKASRCPPSGSQNSLPDTNNYSSQRSNNR